MRQDRRFHEGEATTSATFARLLSGASDWLVTVDPHLHRHASLGELYSIPATAVHASRLLSLWIREHVRLPLLIGPDAESRQWVADVAAAVDAPFMILEKVRHGDRDVDVAAPDLARWGDRTPVLVDDIISTGRTMIETVGHLRRTPLSPPVCVGVHAVFAGDAFRELIAAGAGLVVTSNTIPHSSNAIDVTALLASAVAAIRGQSGEARLNRGRTKK